MAAEVKCDSCGKRAPMVYYGKRWIKPDGWRDRANHGQAQIACSQACAEKLPTKAA